MTTVILQWLISMNKFFKAVVGGGIMAFASEHHARDCRNLWGVAGGSVIFVYITFLKR